MKNMGYEGEGGGRSLRSLQYTVQDEVAKKGRGGRSLRSLQYTK